MSAPCASGKSSWDTTSVETLNCSKSCSSSSTKSRESSHQKFGCCSRSLSLSSAWLSWFTRATLTVSTSKLTTFSKKWLKGSRLRTRTGRCVCSCSYCLESSCSDWLRPSWLKPLENFGLIYLLSSSRSSMCLAARSATTGSRLRVLRLWSWCLSST